LQYFNSRKVRVLGVKLKVGLAISIRVYVACERRSGSICDHPKMTK
jgi:hypothetical protein